MIHYHGINGADCRVMHALRGRHLLWSFAHAVGTLDKLREICATYCIDSGAYTAWRGGKPLDRAKYADLCDGLMHDPALDFVVAPDVIDAGWDANASVQSEWIRQLHTKPGWAVPVWHLDETPAALAGLDYWCRAYPRLAIGTSGDYIMKSQNWWRAMRRAWEVIAPGGRPRVRVHGFRMLDREIVLAFPWSSCDSCTATMNTRAQGKERIGAVLLDGASKPVRALIAAQSLEATLPPHEYKTPPKAENAQEVLWWV